MSELASATEAIEFEVVKDDPPMPVHKGGRPLALTARKFIKVCQRIERGESASGACRLEVVDYTTLRKHVSKKPTYQRRLKEAEAVRLHRRREEAEAIIQRAAEKSWPAAAWLLERRFPDEFALKHVHRPTENQKGEPMVRMITEAQLLEMQRRTARIAKQAPQYGLP